LRRGRRLLQAKAMIFIATGPALLCRGSRWRQFFMTTESAAPVGLVNITDKAAEKAKALLEARELTDGALRVFVAGGGCSGYQYGMALARRAEEHDHIPTQF